MNAPIFKLFSFNVDSCIVEGLERYEHTAITLCDLLKVFECVSYDILLEKVNYYEISGVPLSLIYSYLKILIECHKVLLLNLYCSLYTSKIKLNICSICTLAKVFFLLMIHLFSELEKINLVYQIRLNCQKIVLC